MLSEKVDNIIAFTDVPSLNIFVDEEIVHQARDLLGTDNRQYEVDEEVEMTSNASFPVSDQANYD